MPSEILSRIPLPSLRLYSSLSILLFSGCVYYAFSVVSRDFNAKPISNLTLGNDERLLDGLEREWSVNSRRIIIKEQMRDIISFMGQDAICIWIIINMAYCCLILIGKTIQSIVFGELRISEQQHLKDKFWNFIFYKFIFVFGVVNVQYLNEVVLWVSWFTVLGFLHLLSQLCKDRFEYLSFSMTTPGWSHIRLVTLLSAILTFSGIMFVVCIGIGLFGGLNTFAFMSAECILLGIRSLHVLTRYSMFLYDMRHGALHGDDSVSWDKRGSFTYYIELVFELGALVVDLLHHVHLLFWSNIFLSMASLVIIMQLRFLIHELQRKFKRHRNYLWVVHHMENSYPLASSDDLQDNSDNVCAICWEKMKSARKLPCSHLFHNSCLQSWLEQDTSCPTCRLALSVQTNPIPTIHQNLVEPERPQPRGNNHFFRFNGSRYVSWLPNFSVEVTHINHILRTEGTTHTSQTRVLAGQIQQMFPGIPLSVIIADLQVTRSQELTVDNILENRIGAHTQYHEGVPSLAVSEYYTDPNQLVQLEASPVSYTQSMSSSASIAHTTGTAAAGYEIERNSNIFGNQNDLLRESSDEVALADRFSKSSAEREKILIRRKDMLLTQARKRFLLKSQCEPHPAGSSATSPTI